MRMILLRICLLVLPFALRAQFPVTISLTEPKVVTVVIENEQGIRVRNLLAETQLPAGDSEFVWDGYDDGVYDAEGDLLRKRVPPGTYTVRGLTSDGISLTYEMTVASGGNPPWRTPDLTGGGWTGDHTSPSGVLFLPQGSGSPVGGGQNQILIVSPTAEAGSPLVWVSPEGNTLQHKQIWGWDGGHNSTRDRGTGAHPSYYAYMLIAKGDLINLRALNTSNTGTTILSYDPANPNLPNAEHKGYGVAVHNQLAVFHAVQNQQLVFVNVGNGQVVGTFPTASITAAKAMTFDLQGRLWIASEDKVVRYNVDRTPATGSVTAATLSNPVEVIASGLENPRALYFNADDSELYVGDWGLSNQVKVYNSSGVLLRTIGNPGNGAQVGLYDEQKMSRPQGMAVDNLNQLWVAESWHLPKRVSIWNATTGQFLRAHYGQPGYGGGGTLDPADKTRMFYRTVGGMIEFRLDWENGSAKPHAIPVQYGNGLGTMSEAYGIEYGTASNGEPSRWQFVNERPFHINGRTYFAGTDGSLRGSNHGPTWMLQADNTARPVSFAGPVPYWPEELNQNYITTRPAGVPNDRILSAWSDLNFDRKIQANEYTHRAMNDVWARDDGFRITQSGYGNETVMQDLSIVTNWGFRIPPPTFDANGVPHYDLSQGHYILPPDEIFIPNDSHYTTSGRYVVPMNAEWVFTGIGTMAGFRNQQKVWTYPVKPTSGTTDKGGDLVYPTKLIGLPKTAPAGEAGEYVAINGERGNIFLMTYDGLFIQTIGGDMRNTPLFRFPVATRGMVVDAPGFHHSFEDENFHPSWNQLDNGEIYLQSGKENISLYKVNGFDSIRRVNFGSVTLDGQALAALPETLLVPARRQGIQTYKVELGGSTPIVDGDLAEYTLSVPIGTGDNSIRGSVRVTNTRLYAGWHTNDPDFLNNAGGDPLFMFKHGGCLDLVLRTKPGSTPDNFEIQEGDVRLLVTQVDGNIRAMLYEPIVPGTDPADQIVMDSPVGVTTFDRIRDVSAHVQLAQAGGNFEISIPNSILGLTPSLNASLRADIGAIRGDGLRTIERVYWNNADTIVISDVPIEARLQPDRWGSFQFVAPLSTPPPFLPVTPPALQVPGLVAKTYSGTWSQLPDFGTLAPDDTQIVALPNLDAFPLLLENFGVAFEGYLKIPTAGLWTLSTRSNDGSILWLQDFPIVDNDGVHTSVTVSRSLYLSAGFYPIRIAYFQFDTGKILDVRWSGPGVIDQTIPPEAFFQIAGGLPEQPTSLAAVPFMPEGANPLRIDVSWTDGGSLETGFILQRATDPYFSANLVTVAKDANVTTHSFTDLEVDRLYYFRVRAVNAQGESGNSPTTTASTTGLGLHFALDEISGTKATSSVAPGIVGDLRNMSGTEWTAGRLGNALAFDGVNDYIEVADHPQLDGFANASFSFWVRPSALNSNIRGLLSKRVGTDSQQSYSIFLMTDNRLFVDLDGSSNRFSTPSGLPADVWTHVAVTFDGAAPSASRARVYINGTLVVTAPETSAIIPDYASKLFIGQMSSGSYLAGPMDDIRIYRRTLGAVEVAKLAAPENNEREMRLFQAGVRVLSGDTDTVSFSVQGQDSSRAYTVSNDGYSPLAFSSPVQVLSSTNCSVHLGNPELPELVPSATATLLLNVVPAAAGPWSATLSVDTNDTARSPFTWTISGNALAGSPGSISFANSTASVAEGQSGSSVLALPVVRSGGVQGTVQVTYAIEADSATPGSDFTAISGVLSWADGEGGPKTIDIPILGDSDYEGDERFVVYLSNATGNAVIGAPSTCKVTIVNDDPLPSAALHYPFDETSGTLATDITVPAMNGTLFNFPANAWGLGRLGNALTFDGVNDYVQTADNDLLDNTATLSFSFWINPSIYSHDTRGLISKRVSSGVGVAYQILLAQDNRLFVDIENTTERLGTTLPIRPDRWTHVAIVFDGTAASDSRLKIYLDGELNISGYESTTTIPNTTGTLRLGHFQGATTQYYAGKMDDVRLYRLILPPEAIRNLSLTPPASPEIAVTRAGAPVALEGTDNVGASIVNQALDVNYLVNNTGTAALRLNYPAVFYAAQNVRAIVSHTPGSSISPEFPSLMTVSVTPQAPGPWSVVVSLPTNDPNAQPARWTLSGTANLALSAPHSLAASAVSPTQIDLTWVDASDNETGFELQRAGDATFTTDLVTTSLPANSSSASVDTLLASTTYYFRIRAVNAEGASAYTATAQATTPSAGSGSTLVFLEDFNSGSTGQVYMARTQNVTSPTTLTTVVVSGENREARFFQPTTATDQRILARPFTAQNLSLDGEKLRLSYDIRLVGNISLLRTGLHQTSLVPTGHDWNNSFANNPGEGLSGRSPAVTVAGYYSFLRNGSTTNNEARFETLRNWSSTGNAPTLGGSGFATLSQSFPMSVNGSVTYQVVYEIERLSATSLKTTMTLSQSGVPQMSLVGTHGSASLMDFNGAYIQTTGDTNSELFLDNLRLEKVGNVSIPIAPSALAATPVSPTQIDLTWVDCSFNEANFELQRASDAAFTTDLVTTSLPADSTSASATGLSENSSYYFRVRAVNTAGSSAYSASAQATTPEAGSGSSLVFLETFDSGGAGQLYMARTQDVATPSTLTTVVQSGDNFEARFYQPTTANDHRILARPFPTQSLSVDGEKLRLSYDLRLLGNISLLRTGLHLTSMAPSGHDWNNSFANNPDQGLVGRSPAVTVTGYYSFFRNGSTTNNEARFEALRDWTSTGSAPTLGGGGFATLSQSFPISVNGSVTYQVVYEIERISPSSLRTTMTLSESGVTQLSLTGTHISASQTDFNGAYIQTNGDSGNELFLDNLRLEKIGIVTAAPSALVLRNAVEIPAADEDVVAQSVESAATTLEYALQNNGDADLNIQGPVTVDSALNCQAQVTLQPAALVSPAGETPFTLQVAPIADGPWSFVVSLPSDDPDTSTYTWTVSGNAEAWNPGEVFLSATSLSAVEGEGVTITATRANGSHGGASVDVTTQDGSALAGTDYTALTATLSWADGEVGEKSLTLQSTADSTFEPDETLGVSLSNAVGAALSAPSSLSVTLLNDDPDPTLVLYYALNESTGTTAADSTANALDGTLVNFPAEPWTAGVEGNALEFDGVNDYVERADSPLLDNTSTLSLSFWVRPGVLNSNPRGLVSKRENTDNQHAFGLFLYTNNRLFVDLHNSNNRFSTVDGLPVNEWTHVALTFDGNAPEASRVKLYLNGVLNVTATETSDIIPDTASPLRLGNLKGNASLFAGTLDEVRVHRRVLSETEIAQLAANPPSAPMAMAVFWDDSSEESLQEESVQVTVDIEAQISTLGTVSFTAPHGRMFRVEYSYDLDTWFPVPGEDAIPGEGLSPILRDLPTSPSTHRFYRIVEETLP